MKRLLGLLGAGVALGTGCNASAAPVRPDSAILATVGEEDLRDLVQAAGDKVDLLHPLDAPSVRGLASDGLRYLLIGVDCPKNSATGCKGVVMQVRYAADDKVTLKGLSNANFNEAAVATWWDEEGGIVGFTRYVHLEGGVTWGNLKSNLALLLSAHPAAQALVATTP